jgi:hypothetical protein
MGQVCKTTGPRYIRGTGLPGQSSTARRGEAGAVSILMIGVTGLPTQRVSIVKIARIIVAYFPKLVGLRLISLDCAFNASLVPETRLVACDD